MFKEEQTIFIDGQPKKRIFGFDNPEKKGSPITTETRELTPEELLKLQEDRKPSSIKVNFLGLLFKEMLEFKDQLGEWLAVKTPQSIWWNFILSQSEFSVDFEAVAGMRGIVRTAIEDIENPLNEAAGKKLDLILFELSKKLRSA